MKQKFAMPDGQIVEKDMPQFKTPWNHDTNFESDRTALYCKDESLTKQEFKEETDINTIINRFLKTGEPPPMPLPEHFVDLTGRTTYFDMQSKISEANRAFYLLPADKRAEFKNDPTLWADAVVRATEDGDGDRLADLGIDVTAERTAAQKAQEPPKATPRQEGTPAPGGRQAASEPSKTDADASAKSDSGEK